MKNILLKSKFLFIFSITILFLSSCGGTRQTASEYFKVKSNYDFTDKSYTLNQNTKLNDIGELNPIDNSKPFFVDGKEYFNVSIKFDKSKFEDFELNQKNIGTSKGNFEITDNKQTEKSDNTILWIGIACVIVTGIIAYLKIPSLKI